MTITKIPRGMDGQDFLLAGKQEAHKDKTDFQALWQEHKETEVLLAALQSILIGVDANGRITRWNSVAESVFNIPATIVWGQPFRECAIQWDWDSVLEGIADCLTHTQPKRLHDIRFTRPDGTEGLLGLMISPIKGDNGTPTGYVVFGADITERRMLEHQLVQAQRLESIGRLAAGIAHEINTPIQYVGDNTRFLKDAFGDLNALLKQYDHLLASAKAGTLSPEMIVEVETAAAEADVAYLLEEIPKAIEQSLEGVERVAKIVRAMKEFSHPGGEDATAVDLNRAIESTLTVARNVWKYVAEVITDFDPNLPSVPCSLGDINQVFLNLIVNAAHAIADVVGDGSKGKGTITISTRRLGDWVELRFTDTGTGIPEEIQAKIFDPFFTTKEVGKGTGQGLSICRAVVVEKHKGTLTCESEVGKGTTFIIRLPIKP